MMKRALFGCWTLVACVALTANARQLSVSVDGDDTAAAADPSGATAFASIGAAVGAAAADETITVGPGTYEISSEIAIDKKLTLVSSDGAGKTAVSVSSRTARSSRT